MRQDVLFIMGMGGPSSIDEIEPFLYNLFSDRDIINFHVGNFMQHFIAKKISKKRCKKIAPEYLKMGFGGASPQNHYNKKIFEKLSLSYEKDTGRKLTVIEGNCYNHPFIEDSIKTLQANKFDKYFFTTIYPQYSLTTVNACFNRLNKSFNFLDGSLNHFRIIPHWYENDYYNQAVACRILEAAEKLNKPLDECHVLYSAHSIPMSYVKKGDPYPEQIKKHIELINKKAGVKSYSLSYQSKVGPVKWLAPSTYETLEQYAIDKKDNIIVVPISFITDHIETLIELDEQLIPIIKDKGLNIVRSRSLNDSDDFIKAFTEILKAS